MLHRGSQDDKAAIQQTLENHRQEAHKSHTYYTEVSARCASEWNEITELEKKSSLSDEEEERLGSLKNKFNLVICANYQICKLVPYWGMSAQPLVHRRKETDPQLMEHNQYP